MIQSNISLQPSVVDVWYGNLLTLGLAEKDCLAVLDAEEQNVLARFKRAELQTCYVLSHGLLRFLLAAYLKINPSHLKIARTAFGKPFLPDYPTLSFNLSHSAAHFVVALADSIPLGVDIEFIKERINLTGLVARCFSLQEQVYWQHLPADEQLSVFFEFWTRKEALVKADGRGIALGLEQCEIDPHQSQSFLHLPASCGLASEWSLLDLQLAEGFKAALVAKIVPLQLRQFLIRDYL